MTGIIGVLGMVLLGWSVSEDRRRFPWKLAGTGVVLQVALATLMLRIPIMVDAVDLVAGVINGVIAKAEHGIEFVFGPGLADPGGPWGFVFAVRVLPVIVYFASLMAVLYHVGAMQRVVEALAWVLRRALGVSGAEALAMASNVFVGQTEAPLCIKPYLASMTRSQLATLMVGGFATIAGSVLAAYVGILAGEDPERRVMFIKHLLTASVLSAPAAFVMARIMFPERESAPIPDRGVVSIRDAREHRNVLDAAAAGAADGLRLALNVGAMLIAFVSLLWLINWPIEVLGRLGPVASVLDRMGVINAARGETLDLQTLLGALFMPIAWSLGVPWAESPLFGTLLGEKLVLTEFVAFDHLGRISNASSPGEALSPRSALLGAYALCGFANFASIAIQIGGLTAIAPERRSDFVSMGLRAMWGGALASWMTAAIAGLIMPA